MATLAPEDVSKFLDAARETNHYLLYCTALLTGMRLGELLGLRWCYVYLDLASVSVVRALYKYRGICRMIEPKAPTADDE